MAGSVGTVYYDVLPEMGKFGPAVAAGVGSIKPAKIQVDADTTKATAGIRGLVGQNSSLDASTRKLANAQGTLRVASARLIETQAKAGAGSARLLSAQESQVRALRNVASASAEVASATAAANRPADGLFKTLGKNVNNPSVQKAASGMLAVGAGLLAAVGVAVKVTADFEQAVSHVAATGSDAKESIGQLRAEALKYGADTAFSAKEAANAQEELIKANVKVGDVINGGLKGSLDLAAAGSLGVADAAGIMATAMSQFNVPGTQASHVADLLAAGAGKAQGEVQDLAGALKYVGPVASGANMSIDQTVGTLAGLADAGIKGEQAGTSLRSMIVSLTAPMGAGAKTIEKYGINVRDASGQFIGMEAAVGELEAKLGGLGQAERDAALARIFGKNSITAATVLYSGGAAGIAKWTAAVNDSGYASEVAATKMDNLKGDVEKLGGALQSAFIGAATSSQTPLRGIVQGVTNLVDAFSGLPAGVQGGLLKVAAIGGIALVATGAVLKLAGAASAAKLAFIELGIGARTAVLAAGAIGVAISIAAVLIGKWASNAATAKASQDSFTQALIASNGVLDQSIAKQRTDSLMKSGAADSANKLGISVGDLTAASLGNADAQARVNDALAKYTDATNAAYGGTDEFGRSTSDAAKDVVKIQEAIAGGNDELKTGQEAYKTYAESVDAGTDALGAESEAHKQQQAAVLASISAVAALGETTRRSAADNQALSQKIFATGDAIQGVAGAHAAYEAAVDGAALSTKKHETALSADSLAISKSTGLLADGTQKQRDAGAAIGQLASSGKAYVASLVAQGASSKDAAAATQKVRDAFVSAADAAGLTKGQANKLADAYGLVPDKVSTKIDAVGMALQQAKVEKYKQALSGLTEPQQIKLQTIYDKSGAGAAEAYLLTLLKPKKVPVVPTVTDGGAKPKLDQYGKTIKAPVAVNVQGDKLAKGKLDYFGNPIKAPVDVKTRGTGKAKSDVKDAAKGRSANVDVKTRGTGKAKSDVKSAAKGAKATVTVGSKGVPKVRSDVKGAAKGAKAPVDVHAKGVSKVKGEVKGAAKGQKATVTVGSKGVSKTKGDINGIKGKSVTISVRQSGVGGVQSSINGIQGKTVTVTVRTVKKSAAGGRAGDGVPGFAAGGSPGKVRGPGGDTSDLIDARLSANEWVIQARTSKLLGDEIMAGINAGAYPKEFFTGRRFATGGSPSSSSSGAGAVGRSPIIINIDLGPELGGIRRIIADEIDQAGEYRATIDGMRR
jgi:TP901 family phage tail tape measure protein